jgi:hypothetical protein
MFTEIQLWEQAGEDRLSVPLDTRLYEARLLFGCKIIRDKLSGQIEFYNTARGGDYYVKLKEEEIDVFKTYGLKQGVYWLMMSNILKRIEGVNDKIRYEVNNRNNFRKIQTFKNYRERLIKLFHHQTKQFKERNYVKDEINLGDTIQD